MKLYEISEQLKTFQQMAEDGYFEDEKTILDTLESIQMEFDNKLENIACMYKGLSVEADAIEAEAKSLMERATRTRKTCEWLKDYMTANLQSVGQSKFESARVRLSFRKSESVSVTNEEVLFNSLQATGMDSLASVVETVKFDKKGLKQALKDGIELNGVELVTNNNLQIK